MSHFQYNLEVAFEILYTIQELVWYKYDEVTIRFNKNSSMKDEKLILKIKISKYTQFKLK